MIAVLFSSVISSSNVSVPSPDISDGDTVGNSVGSKNPPPINSSGTVGATNPSVGVLVGTLSESNLSKSSACDARHKKRQYSTENMKREKRIGFETKDKDLIGDFFEEIYIVYL